jgi:hypothetical protein
MLNKDRGQAGKFVDHELVEWQMGQLFLDESLIQIRIDRRQ